MKKCIPHVVAVIALSLLVSCSQEPEPVTLLVYQGGNEYLILDRGDSYDQGHPAYLVRYYSEDPGDTTVLNAESRDLYAIIAKHIDTNKHERVIIEAVEQKGRLFGIMPQREVRVSKTVEEVMTYTPKAKKLNPNGVDGNK